MNFKQISFVFVGKIIKNTKKLYITEKEKYEGARLLWNYPDKALELITNFFDKIKGSSYDSTYSSKFMLYRDRKLLDFYISMQLLNKKM